MALLDDLVALKAATLSRHPEFRTDQPARTALRRLLSEALEDATDVRTFGPVGRRRGAVVLCAQRPAFLGASVVECVLLIDADDEAAIRWAGQTLHELRASMDERLMLSLDVAYGALLPAAKEAGLVVSKLLLHGAPKAALSRLEAHGISGDPGDLGVSFQPLESQAQVDEIVELRRTYFRSRADRSFLAHEIDDEEQAAIDEALRANLQRALTSGLGTHFVVLRADQLVGDFGFLPRLDHPLLGSTAGIGIIFSEPIHGMGLSVHAYRMMLQRMIQLKIAVLRGVTTNPAVIHLARRMGRPLRSWMLGIGGTPLSEELVRYQVD